jgi:[protein-PII] uridylyltransferase
VVDVFYVKDLFGHKVDHDKKLKDVREHLVEVMAEAREPRVAAE